MTVLFLLGIFIFSRANGTNLDGSSLNKDIYPLPNGGTRSCIRRSQKDACPYDYEMRVCQENGTESECYPCDKEAGYRNCVRVFSDIKDVICSRPQITCKPSEIVIITNTSDGGCSFHCICNARKGYILNGSECVLLGTKCGINSTIINDKCTGCPSGKYKPEVGFEDCIPIPEEKPIFQSSPGTTHSPFGTTVKPTKVIPVPTKASSDVSVSSDKPPGQTHDDSSNTDLYLKIFLPLIFVGMILFLITVCICYWKRSQGVGGNAVYDKDLERGERDIDEPVSAPQDNGTLPPSYRTNATKDSPHVPNGFLSNGDAPHRADDIESTISNQEVHSVPQPAKEIHEPEPVPSNAQTEAEPFLPYNHSHTDSQMLSSRQFKSFPTLGTEGPSSLQANSQTPVSHKDTLSSNRPSSSAVFKSYPTLWTKGPSSLVKNQQSPDNVKTPAAASGGGLTEKGRNEEEEKKHLLAEGEEIAMSELNGNVPGGQFDYNFGSKLSVI